MGFSNKTYPFTSFKALAAAFSLGSPMKACPFIRPSFIKRMSNLEAKLRNRELLMFNPTFVFHSTNIILMLQVGEVAETGAEPISRNYVFGDHFAWGNHLVKSDIRLQDGKSVCNCSKYDICKRMRYMQSSTLFILCRSANKQ